MEKRGDFRPGESRADEDMTKIAKVEEGFYVAGSAEDMAELQKQIKPCCGKCQCGPHISVGNLKGIKKVKFD